MIHGLPGCGKSTLIERQAEYLKQKIETKKNWLVPIINISIKNILAYRLTPVDFCYTLFSEILREYKPLKQKIGRPAIIIIQDLDALVEQKMVPTSDIREGQKIGIIIKDFLREINEK